MKRYSSFTFFVFNFPFYVLSDHLNAVALRPTLMYGECDERFFPTIMRLADRWNGKIPRIAEGGKKQLSYVGELLELFLGPFHKLCLFAFDFSIVFHPVECLSGIFLFVEQKNITQRFVCNKKVFPTGRSKHVKRDFLLKREIVS